MTFGRRGPPEPVSAAAVVHAGFVAPALALLLPAPIARKLGSIRALRGRAPPTRRGRIPRGPFAAGLDGPAPEHEYIG